MVFLRLYLACLKGRYTLAQHYTKMSVVSVAEGGIGAMMDERIFCACVNTFELSNVKIVETYRLPSTVIFNYWMS